ncbi:TPA: hypothetical protein N3Y92_002971 [Klebsiella pneumoniae]|nr:hypothetical protein [Klebsiella pneumoniae]HDH1522856.1 hypothetical protein [Klebsiella quasipneumoniae subsp. similipneumoniae]EKL8593024.1 hypothetical protein [Klebsiella pneumoniae]EKV6039091.1 hypothetical protein [Klebsiella pneumoniae]HCM5968240.1 hypothetical protein [Klebsiella pneumoniae]
MINSSIQSLLQQAISSGDEAHDFCLVKADADLIKGALLGGISFLGRELDESAAQSKVGRGYGPADLADLGRFLNSSVELIKMMDAVIDGCNDSKDSSN